MAETTSAIRKSASKLGLMMNFEKTEKILKGHYLNKYPMVPVDDE